MGKPRSSEDILNRVHDDVLDIIKTAITSDIASILDHNQVALSDTTAQIVAANTTTRKFGVLIKSLSTSTNICFVADVTVTTATGMELVAGDAVFIPGTNAMNGICASTETATVAFIEV